MLACLQDYVVPIARAAPCNQAQLRAGAAPGDRLWRIEALSVTRAFDRQAAGSACVYGPLILALPQLAHLPGVPFRELRLFWQQPLPRHVQRGGWPRH